MKSTAKVPPSIASDLRALLQAPRDLWIVFLATFFEYLGVYSFLSTLTLWLSSDHHFDDKAAGWWAATFSTLLTLVVVPVLYSYLVRDKKPKPQPELADGRPASGGAMPAHMPASKD